MPKRKRSEADVDETLAQLQKELSRALKAAKGLERLQQMKRMKNNPEKTDRIQKEVLVLKSLDLNQTANAVLANSLLKVKSIAESPRLPQEIKAGAIKPDISAEEKTLLHNVTSALCNRREVRGILDKAVNSVCKALRVPMPEKGKGKKSASTDRKEKSSDANTSTKDGAQDGKSQTVAAEHKDPKSKASRPQPGAAGDIDSADEEEQEAAVAELDKLLGNSSESGSDQEDDDEESQEELDPMEITSDEGEEEDDGLGDIDLEDESDEESFQGFDDDPMANMGNEASPSEESDSEDSESSPPSKKTKPTKREKTASAKPSKPTDSTFLPTLMSGYISGSESASDIEEDLSHRKNRRGQRARQAIWEKKFKDQAKHLKKQQDGKNAGWDPKKGAVGGDGDRKPWKQGVRDPLQRKARGDGATDRGDGMARQPPVEKKKPQNDGPLHPSWEAAKKAKEKAQTAAFQGKKTTFD